MMLIGWYFLSIMASSGKWLLPKRIVCTVQLNICFRQKHQYFHVNDLTINGVPKKHRRLGNVEDDIPFCIWGLSKVTWATPRDYSSYTVVRICAKYSDQLQKVPLRWVIFFSKHVAPFGFHKGVDLFNFSYVRYIYIYIHHLIMYLAIL